MSETLLQSWILDYACCHHFESIIQDISKRNNGHLESLDVCHSRLAFSTIYFIVHNEQFSYFDAVIQTIEQLHKDFPSHLINNSIYSRLITGLKIKSLFNELKGNINNALLKLNVYFPRISTNKGNEDLLEKQRNFRKFLLSLIANKNQRKVYLNNEFHSDFGMEFMESIKNLTDKFLNSLETYLIPPVLDLLLASDSCQNLPVLSPETEMLLDFIYDVKNHRQNEDETSEGKQKEKTVKFKEKDLLHMLNLLCPLNPEEIPSIDHHISLTRLTSDSILTAKEKTTCSDQIQSQQESFDKHLQQNEQESQEFSTPIDISTMNREESEEIKTCSEKLTSPLTQETNTPNLEPNIQTHSGPLQTNLEPETHTHSESLQTNLKESDPKSVSICDLPRKQMNLVGSDAFVLQPTNTISSHDEQIENISVNDSTNSSHNNNYHYQTSLGFDQKFSSESDIFQSLSDSSSDFNDNYNIVCPPGSDSAQIFYCGNPFNVEPNYTCINKQPKKGINACIIKLFRNEDFDIIDKKTRYIYHIYT